MRSFRIVVGTTCAAVVRISTAFVGLPKDNGKNKSMGELAKLWEANNSTPGLELTFKEVQRESLDQSHGEPAGKTGVTYNLLASGFPKGPIFTLWVRTLGTEPRSMATGFSVDDSGKFACLTPPAPPKTKDRTYAPWCDKPLEVMNLLMVGAKGEPKRAALISQDFKVRSFAEIISFPIEATDGPCRLTVELAEPVGEAFKIAGEGFEPNEEVSVTDQSEDEVLGIKDKADATGRIGALLLPAVLGKNSGAASWTVQSKACHVRVDYNWGKAAFEWQ
jgi:hypothetical protein